MAEALPSQTQANLRLPIEVHERIIDAIFDDRYSLVLDALAMLSSCALVCRAWRPRAQRILFEYVLLRDKDALFRLAELINASPELGTYVRKLALRGYLHVPYSLVVLFLTALRGKLPNLSVLNIQGFDDEERAANPPPEAQKELPTLPIHPYFPSLVKSISHIHSLSLVAVKFPSFGDFARFLAALPNLTDLFCLRVSWAVDRNQHVWRSVTPATLARRSCRISRSSRTMPWMGRAGRDCCPR
ncbi:hypothetical protein K466DRAFT_304701 [Polyporus arcularius HHB13444]|uniref:F-box domain-containing protein n=1 Tax=Polyporus arcularius HHB13444 TaxID=1314778 RepID=A0A5C3NY00_9APHY|nr:hypothetical protein K466DRAFT_304701 [Polyporus arcularius HHB13444]